MLAACVLMAGGPASAEPRVIDLDPAQTQILFLAWAFGILPVQGSFARFHGTLSYDPSQPGLCDVTISLDVASLVMDDKDTRVFVISPEFLNVVDWPDITYQGTCQQPGIAGELRLHGVTRVLGLSVKREAGRFNAEATLRRADWGMTGHPMLVGPYVHIRISADLPLPP
jgi:polyisoprenoid-binding protein YceI